MITKDKTVRASLINLAVAKNDLLLTREQLSASAKANYRNMIVEAFKESFRTDDEYEKAKASLKAVKATGTAKDIAEAKAKLAKAKHQQTNDKQYAKTLTRCFPMGGISFPFR
jgi:hypothetical protein